MDERYNVDKFKKQIHMIADHYGYETQSEQLIEECAELIQAVNKVRRAKGHGKPIRIGLEEAKANLLSEIADVEVMVEQIKYLLHLEDDALLAIKQEKVTDTLRKISKEEVADDAHKMNPTTAPIRQFDGEYAFLSNFWTCPVHFDGMLFQSAEAAFQAAKCINLEDRKQFQMLLPNQAKQLGRRISLRPDWEDVKDNIMEAIIRDKFTRNEDLKHRLLSTGDAKLFEGNYWHDLYWGVDGHTGDGLNRLGIILMKVRNELQSSLP